MENPIIASNLNDFIFCPVSIYFHNLYGNRDVLTYKKEVQLNGTSVHNNVDNGEYSTRKDIVSGISAYSEKYNIICKIDIYDKSKKILVERKNKISKIYDGQIFQVYAQYFALKELGYDIEKIKIHSISDNKNYYINLPDDNIEMFNKFKNIIYQINNFDFEEYKQTNVLKCQNCIYEPACSKSIKEE